MSIKKCSLAEERGEQRKTKCCGPLYVVVHKMLWSTLGRGGEGALKDFNALKSCFFVELNLKKSQQPKYFNVLAKLVLLFILT